MIKVNINNKEITGFEAISVSTDINEISGSFRLTVSGEEFTNNILASIEIQHRIVFKIGKVSILNGFVEKLIESETINTSSNVFIGRDKTCDLMDSTFESAPSFTGKNSLQNIIKQVLVFVKINKVIPDEINDIKVINTVSAADLNDFDGIQKPSPGQGVFEFIEKLARLKQVALIPDGSGNIVISRGNTNETGATLVWKKGNEGAKNNILKAGIRTGTTNRFRKYVVKGQQSHSNLGLIGAGQTESGTITNSGGFFEDKDVRESRTLTIISEGAVTTDQAKPRAEWQANFNKYESTAHTVDVQGFTREDKGVWKVGDVVTYIRDKIGFSGEQVVTAINYSFSKDRGSVSTLTLKDKDLYTKVVKKPIDEQVASKSGIAGLFTGN